MQKLIATAIVATSLLISQPVFGQAPGPGEHWVGTWATAVVARAVRPPAGRGGGQGAPPPAAAQAAPAPAPAPPAPPINFSNQTLREIVHISIGGASFRIVLSNQFGDAPLAIGAAHVGVRSSGAAIIPGSDHAVTFAGKKGAIMAPGAVMFSDPIALTAPPLADLAVSIYLPGDTGAGTSPLTMHAGANQTNYVSAAGDHTADADLQGATTIASWYFLSRVEVVAQENVSAIVALGDSITDGARTTADTNSRWPDVLSRRLTQVGLKVGVLNLGIAGNRILQDGAGVSALARFDRDVAAQTGAGWLIFMEGINDIRNNLPLTTDDLIAAHRQIIDRAHARGLKVIGGTLTPFEGSAPLVAYTPETEAKRQALNAWIRTGKAYDAVIDFDAVVRDPNHPTQLIEQQQSGDHLHPNDTGYQLMGNAIGLDLFSPSVRTSLAPTR